MIALSDIVGKWNRFWKIHDAKLKLQSLGKVRCLGSLLTCRYFSRENVIDLVNLMRVLSFQSSVTDESLEIFNHNFPVKHN